MPNKIKVEKKFISFSLPREVVYKLTQAAKERNIDRTTYVARIFEDAVKDVELTDENKELIASEIKKESERRKKYVF